MSTLTRDIATNIIEVDLSRVTVIDSAGLAVLIEIEKIARDKAFEFRLIKLPPKVLGFLDLIDRKKLDTPQISPYPPTKYEFVNHVGELALEAVGSLRSVLTFLGGVIIAFVNLFRHPGKFRRGDFFIFVERAGTDALPIVSLLSLLMGLIMAFQAAVQLRQFGANIFVADLVALSLLRELGPLLTAIIIAGRSGAAFAAEIGTMKISEEVDALNTMGFEPVSFLALPRITAVTFVGPLLTLVADLVGVLGGLIVGIISLDLSATAYIEETYLALTPFDLLSGLIKSIVFALLIGGVGCLRGFEVEMSADSVGRKTTSAVVSGIFLIVFTDAIFTILFHYF